MKKRLIAVSLAGLLTMSAAGAAFAGGPAHPDPTDHDPNAASTAGEVVICHKPGTKAERTMSVNGNALDSHLAHGDNVAAC